ncbi:major royal jelly protein [Diplogelasinospora grovesii]|uniref:Major royal jelly protein n=1 Tax=Diplogelasinospora grovesii TaxID=303347 RepID=A0AAN6S3N8_9PEZI|nr:major royal jelly protein [Diplogelasinospora grovesii]
MVISVTIVVFSLASVAAGRNFSFLTDWHPYGPALEVAHAYYGQWPTAIAVSKTGRMFSAYPGGLDPKNANNGTNNIFTVAELTSTTNETAYPSVEMNSPPGGAINYTTSPPRGANYANYLISVQAVVIDALDRLWILDTGRVSTPDLNTIVGSAYGGPKLIGINLTTNQVFQTIMFPENVVFQDSYPNDMRFDLRSRNSSKDGYGQAGVAYITDSSPEARNGLIIVDLHTGHSWRHLSLGRSVRSEAQFLPFVLGQPVYSYDPPTRVATWLPDGGDGIALSADGDELYYSPLASRYLHSVPTRLLKTGNKPNRTSELKAQGAVMTHGQKGVSDGFETDSNGLIYMGNFEANAIVTFNPRNGSVTTFVRDPRINWVDTSKSPTEKQMSIAEDGYLYFTVNQLNLGVHAWPGTDRRRKPYALFRVPLPNNGTKVRLV